MNFTELYDALDKLKDSVKTGASEGLEKGAKRIADAAKAKPGAYQSAVPPFSGWPKLKSGNSPLLKSGVLRDSITVDKVNENLIQVGVSGYGAIHEAGSSKIPQRAFLRPASIETKEQILKHIVDGISSKL